MSLVASAALFGILIGSPLGGWAGDKYGRKPLFMIDMGLFVVASILQFFVGSFEMLLAVRLLMGIAIGAEYSEPLGCIPGRCATSGTGDRGDRRRT